MTSRSSAVGGPASAASRSPGPPPEPRHRLRLAFGVVLFVAWGLLTYIWVASTVYLAGHGTYTAAITPVGAIAVLLLLGGMEGLEVSVIDRWQKVWPGRQPSYLAGWLAARQLFVALIVTSVSRPARLWPTRCRQKATSGLTAGILISSSGEHRNRC